MLKIGNHVISVEPESASRTNSTSSYIVLDKIEAINRSASENDNKDEGDNILYSVYAQMCSGKMVLCYQGYGLSAKSESSKIAIEMANAINKSKMEQTKSDRGD